MKRLFLFAILLILGHNQLHAQRNCGIPYIKQRLLNEDSTYYKAFFEQIALKNADLIKQHQAVRQISKTTKDDTLNLNVVFHLVIDSLKFNSMGGYIGIENRIKTQLQVLNEAFNGANPDRTMIPSVWEPVFANAGIWFNKAALAPDGSSTPGYTITIVPNGTKYTALDACKAAKFKLSGGHDAWDTDKYVNIWVVDIDVLGSTILGITAPTDWPEFTSEEWGIALNYRAFGVRTSPSDNFVRNFDKGKTLVHELGHYFGLAHTWGDDGGLCPGTGGIDDGISDTPPQGSESTGKPTFPKFDICTPSGDGIMFYNYLDYTDDSVIVMFTEGQKVVMRALLSEGGALNSLTRYKFLGDSTIELTDEIKIFPNPTRGKVFFQYNLISNPLNRVQVFNHTGQKVLEKSEINISFIDMSNFSKGYYYLKCFFGKETITKTIILSQ